MKLLFSFRSAFRLCCCFLFFLIEHHTSAQTFSGSGGNIPDYSNARYFLLNIPALDSPQLNARFGLKKVCIEVTHPHIADISISLLAPSGAQTELVSGAGGSGANFTGTCFSMNATTTIISGTAPFTGIFYPRHNIGEVNDGSSGAGTWRLIVQDIVKGDSGVLNNWALTFDTAAPAPLGTPIGPCNKYNPAGCGCPDSTNSQCRLLPDIVIGETWFFDTLRRREFHDSITVSTSTANIGWGPMEIIGTNRWYCADSEVNGNVICNDGLYSRQLVQQRIYKKTNTGFFDFEDTLVGYMRFHSELGHHHLHVEDWVENTLRIRGPETDPSKWPVVGRGTKVSVSLYDHVGCDTIFRACDYQGTPYQLNTLRNGGLGLGYASGGAQVQGISVGYADIYENLLPFGQAIYFDSICNGDYILMAQFDPKHRFVDFDNTNNITYTKISLHKQRDTCCEARIEIDTIDFEKGMFRFIDRSVAMPNSWNWHFGSDSSNQQFPFYQFQKGGSNQVTLETQTAAGCRATAQVQLILPANLQIPDLRNFSRIALSPNPGHGAFQLEIESESPAVFSAQLFDVRGQKVSEVFEHEAVHQGSNRFRFICETPGLYLLQIRTGNQVYTKKVAVY
ncbi:MAG: proprotein convertase P-domain-containing protein [Chitinophagales bacterium]